MSRESRIRRAQEKAARASGRSGEVPTSALQPVSREAVDAAILRVVGPTKSTDVDRYGTFVNHVRTKQPGFLNALESLYTMRAPVVGEGNMLVDNAYIGGGLLYLAACEEQSRIKGSTLPVFRLSTLKDVFVRPYIEHGNGDHLARFMAMMGESMAKFGNTEPPVDMGSLSISGIEKARRIAEASSLEQEADALVLGPNAAANTALLEEAKNVARAQLHTQIAVFTNTETGFLEGMNDLWWNDASKDPLIGTSQLFGATDAAYMFETEALLLARGE